MIKNDENGSKIVGFLRSEITFWLTIIGIVVSAVIAFSRLDARVLANETKLDEKIEVLNDIDKKVDLLLVRQAEMQKDIQYIVDLHK